MYKNFFHIVLIAVSMNFLSAKADTFINYSTGELFEGSWSDENYKLKESIVEDSKGLTIELNINYAQISPWWEDPQYVLWYITGGKSETSSEGRPVIPFWNKMIKIPDQISNVEIVDFEYGYKDFNNYRLAPCWPMEPDCGDDWERPWEPYIEPYEGFFPSELIDYELVYNRLLGGNFLFLVLQLAQYDYENSVVRAHTNMKVRINYKYPEGVSCCYEDSCNPIYYDLHGARIEQPKAGGIYIENKNGTISKKIK